METNNFKDSLKVANISKRRTQIIRLKNVVKSEIKHMTNSNLYTLDEKLEQLDDLYNIYKILNNYDELKPVLQKFFKERHEKEKWER